MIDDRPASRTTAAEARAATRLKRWPEAAERWNELAEGGGPSPEAFLQLSRARRKCGEFRRGRRAALRGLRRYPHHVPGALRLLFEIGTSMIKEARERLIAVWPDRRQAAIDRLRREIADDLARAEWPEADNRATHLMPPVAIRDIATKLDRLAGEDPFAASELRMQLSLALFAPLATFSELDFSPEDARPPALIAAHDTRASAEDWACIESTNAGSGHDGASPRRYGPVDPSDAATLQCVRDAVRDGCSPILTNSLMAAYLAGLTDIPVALKLSAPPREDDGAILRELARLDSVTFCLDRPEDLPEAIGQRLARDRATARFGSAGSAHRGEHRSEAPVLPATQGLEDVAASIEKTDRSADRPLRIAWIYGPSHGDWAYGVNARRLARHMPRARHHFGSVPPEDVERFDIKLSFDLLIHRDSYAGALRAGASVLRVGGHTPLQAVSGGDLDRLRAALSDVDAVIVLSLELQRELAAIHPDVFFIPNGLDLDVWSPDAACRTDDGVFRVGMAASLETSAQRDTKGLHIAREACARAGVELLAIGRGIEVVPQAHVIDRFYRRIDALVHPVAPGKEGSSNVIMECLALGIPVITTRYAGFHGAVLENGKEAIIVRRTAQSFAAAIAALRDDAALRAALASHGREFACRHHDLSQVAGRYDDVFRHALARRT